MHLTLNRRNQILVGHLAVEKDSLFPGCDTPEPLLRVAKASHIGSGEVLDGRRLTWEQNDWGERRVRFLFFIFGFAGKVLLVGDNLAPVRGCDDSGGGASTVRRHHGKAVFLGLGWLHGHQNPWPFRMDESLR